MLLPVPTALIPCLAVPRLLPARRDDQVALRELPWPDLESVVDGCALDEDGVSQAQLLRVYGLEERAREERLHVDPHRREGRDLGARGGGQVWAREDIYKTPAYCGDDICVCAGRSQQSAHTTHGAGISSQSKG